MRSSEILLDDVCCNDRQRESAALQAATGRGEELAPLIVARFEKVLSDPNAESGEGRRYLGFLFFLAAEFRVTAAHAPLCAILRLDRDRVDELLGDALTGGMDCALAQTFAGDTAPLLGLVADSAAEPYARGAGLDAVAKLWKRGHVPREALLALLTRLAENLDPGDEDATTFANELVEVAVQVGAFEIRDSILGLYERGLADPYFYEREYTEAQLRPGAPPAQEARRLDQMIESAWAWVQSWDYFSPWSAPVPAHDDASGGTELPPPPAPPSVEGRQPWTPPVPFRAPPKTGRNDPCPCGSGKKFKKCCGA